MKPGAIAFGLLLAACSSAPSDDLSDGVCELPRELREVSAIAARPDGRLACVQDELGAIFTFDPAGKQPTSREVFGERGDYEALAVVGDVFYVLRSDGWVARVQRVDGVLRVAASVFLPGGHKEWEALCHDAGGRRLLAMPKIVGGDRKSERELRPIYAIDPVAMVALAEPVGAWNRRSLVDQAAARGIALPTRTTDKGKERIVLELEVSDIACVPGTADMLLLSAADRVLLRVDFEGRLLGAVRLDAAALPQPEGLTFLPDGRLVVASEGAGGAGRLVVVPAP
ncbi:MAG: hypothetical protein JNK15_01385 [Planctomycetes bacterium]|nr:hypothetical protein [Planctomycetota bacterium]